MEGYNMTEQDYPFPPTEPGTVSANFLQPHVASESSLWLRQRHRNLTESNTKAFLCRKLKSKETNISTCASPSLAQTENYLETVCVPDQWISCSAGQLAPSNYSASQGVGI